MSFAPARLPSPDELARWALTPDPDAAWLLPAGQHPTLLARDFAGRRVILKLGSLEADDAVAHEARVLAALAALPGQGTSPLRLPAMLTAHLAPGRLALAWVEGAQNLAHRLHEPAGLSPAIAAAMGRGLGWLHTATRTGQLPGDGGALGVAREPWELQALVYLEPDFYARLGPFGRAFYLGLQATPDLFDALHGLLNTRGDRCTLHGDLKFANLLVSPPFDSPDLPADVTFIDWELAGQGDPARDLGAIGAAFAQARWHALGSEPLALEAVQACLRSLWDAYAQERGAAFPLPDGFLAHVSRWTGAALLWGLLGMGQDGRLASFEPACLEPARVLLVRPAVGVRDLWGLDP